MKKLLILVLFVAIGAAAYFAKPQDPKASFEQYRVATGENELEAKLDATRCEFVNHVLWVDAKVGGKTVYTNVFSRWVNRGDFKAAVQEDLEKGKDKMDKAVDKVAGKGS